MKREDAEMAVKILVYSAVAGLPFQFGYCTQCRSMSRYDERRCGAHIVRQCKKCNREFTNAPSKTAPFTSPRPLDLDEYIVNQNCAAIPMRFSAHIALLNTKKGQEALVARVIEKEVKKNNMEINRLRGEIEKIDRDTRFLRALQKMVFPTSHA